VRGNIWLGRSPGLLATSGFAHSKWGWRYLSTLQTISTFFPKNIYVYCSQHYVLHYHC